MSLKGKGNAKSDAIRKAGKEKIAEQVAHKKKLFLALLEKHNGINYRACAEFEMTPKQVRNWKQKDKEFEEACHDIERAAVEKVVEIMDVAITKKQDPTLIALKLNKFGWKIGLGNCPIPQRINLKLSAGLNFEELHKDLCKLQEAYFDGELTETTFKNVYGLLERKIETLKLNHIDIELAEIKREIDKRR